MNVNMIALTKLDSLHLSLDNLLECAFEAKKRGNKAVLEHYAKQIKIAIMEEVLAGEVLLEPNSPDQGELVDAQRSQ